MTNEKERLLKELKFRNSEMELIIYKLEEKILYLRKRNEKKNSIINKINSYINSLNLE